MSDILHISYVSRLRSQAELVGLVGQIGHFRDRNLELGITGCIAFEDDRIMQVIEGERRVAERMFDTICRDARHVDVISLEHKMVERMSFRHWGMIRRPIADVLFLTQLT